MACDHLDKKTFDNAMEVIKENYYEVASIFNGELTNAMKNYYDAWQSKKGFEKVSSLYVGIADALDRASNNIVSNYTSMRDSAREYARSQNMWIIVGDIDKKSFEAEIENFSDDREIIISDEKISSAGDSLTSALKKINTCLDNSQNQAMTDASFGYYSDNGDNPRQNMWQALSNVQIALSMHLDRFSSNFAQELEQDKVLREQHKQKAAIENNNFSDIF